MAPFPTVVADSDQFSADHTTLQLRISYFLLYKSNKRIYYSARTIRLSEMCLSILVYWIMRNNRNYYLIEGKELFGQPSTILEERTVFKKWDKICLIKGNLYLFINTYYLLWKDVYFPTLFHDNFLYLYACENRTNLLLNSGTHYISKLSLTEIGNTSSGCSKNLKMSPWKKYAIRQILNRRGKKGGCVRSPFSGVFVF